MAALDRILAHHVFHISLRRSCDLSSKSLSAARPAGSKATRIVVEALGRNETFDPQADLSCGWKQGDCGQHSKNAVPDWAQQIWSALKFHAEPMFRISDTVPCTMLLPRSPREQPGT